jgi:tRNA uridine 5-carbamoylmethylation protein Kti12
VGEFEGEGGEVFRVSERFWGDGYHEYQPYCHQVNDIGQDYSLFEVSCGVCGLVLFEFVHHMKKEQPDWVWRHYDKYGPPASAQSWYKPIVRVLHNSDTGEHVFLALEKGTEDKNQVVRCRPMTHYQFQEWKKVCK